MKITYKEYLDTYCPLYTHHTSKREIRHDFFKRIDSELQAYLLGYIMADGSINDKRATVTIHINEKDKEIFKLFKIISPNAYIEKCKPTESIATIDKRTIKNDGSIRLAIASSILIEDLHKLGIVQNKTYEQLSIPKMKESLVRHFIRGYWDGDGWFTWIARKPNPKNREKNWRISGNFGICGKTDNLFLEIQKILQDNNINCNVNYLKRKDYYTIIGSAKQSIINFYNFIYKDSHFYLSRKYNKYSHYVNTEVTQLIAEYRNAQEVNVNESNNPPTSPGHPNSNEKDENVC